MHNAWSTHQHRTGPLIVCAQLKLGQFLTPLLKTEIPAITLLTAQKEVGGLSVSAQHPPTRPNHPPKSFVTT